MEAPKNPQQQGYYPLQEQITYSPEQEYPPQKEHIPKEGYENVIPYPLGQQQPYIPSTQAVPVTQQQISNIVAIQSQPTGMSVNTVIHPTKDHYLTSSIVLTFICLFVGNFHTLLCTIPAIILAIRARRAETHGDLPEAQSKARVALILNIVSFVVGSIVVNYFIIFTAVTTADTISHYRMLNYYKIRIVLVLGVFIIIIFFTVATMASTIAARIVATIVATSRHSGYYR